MVKLPWRRGPSSAEADRLVAAAEDQAMLHGAGPATNQAALVAVDAARHLANHGDRHDRGRLLRALGRLALNLALGRTHDDARRVVRETADLARDLLAEPGPGGDDPVRAEAIIRLAQAGQIIAVSGGAARGKAMVAEAWAAAEAGPVTGPHARRARAAVLAAIVQDRVDDQEQRLAQAQDVDGTETMRLAVDLVDTQRAVAIADDDAPAVSDLADALTLLGRAAVVVDRPDLTGAAWSEEMSILTSFDGGGAKDRFAQAADRIRGFSAAHPQIEVVVPGPDAWRHAPSYAEAWASRSAPTPVPLDDPDLLDAFAGRLEQAIELSRGGARLAEAETLLGQVVSEMMVYDTGPSLEAQRVLARAAWRLGQVRHAAGRAETAWPMARLSVSMATRRLEQVPGDRAGLADAVTYMCDAGEIAAAAGQPGERITLLRDAIRLGDGIDDRAVRRALGTALHNLGTARAHEFVASARAGNPDLDLLTELTATADRAREVRRDLVDPADPLTLWEYANTLVMAAGVAVSGQRWAVAVDCLSTAGPLLGRLGPTAAEMTLRARRAARACQAEEPGLVLEAAARGDWPY